MPLWCNRSTRFVVMFSQSCKVFSVYCYVLLPKFLRKFYIQSRILWQNQVLWPLSLFQFWCFWIVLTHLFVFFIFHNELAFRCLNMISKTFFGLIIFSRTVCRLLDFLAALPSSAYHFWLKLISLTGFLEGKMASPYMSLLMGLLI